MLPIKNKPGADRDLRPGVGVEDDAGPGNESQGSEQHEEDTEESAGCGAVNGDLPEAGDHQHYEQSGELGQNQGDHLPGALTRMINALATAADVVVRSGEPLGFLCDHDQCDLRVDSAHPVVMIDSICANDPVPAGTGSHHVTVAPGHA